MIEKCTCGNPLGEVDDGVLKVRKENHEMIYIYGWNRVVCGKCEKVYLKPAEEK